MNTRKDLTGLVAGRLEVIGHAIDRYWLCRCACGREKIVRNDHLRTGKIRSCGCFHDEAARTNNTKHGANRRDQVTPEYRTWTNMITRCTRSIDKSYADYGGRGITICERWREDFSAFLADMGLRPSAKHSIDRINVDGNYEPSNCRWATRVEQARNTRKRRLITVDGITRTLAEWGDVTGMDKRLIHARLKGGWSERDAVLTPAMASGYHRKPAAVEEL